MPITRLLLVLEVWDGKPTYRKSWAGNLLVWSDLTLGPSLKVKSGQPNLKVLITCLLLVLEVLVHCLYAGYNLHRFSPLGGGHIIFCFFRWTSSAVRTLGFRSFEGKVFILSLPNLVWVFIGLIACMGLLLVKIGL